LIWQWLLFLLRRRIRKYEDALVIVAGNKDRLVDIDAQSARLYRDVPQSQFHRVAGAGHMIHQTATAVVMSAIDEVAHARIFPS
jgi:pimeloyl-ACP methyl ester carboxylesterase